MTNGRQRAPVAEMTSDQPKRLQVSSENLSGALSAILVANSVKAVAADSVLEPLIRAAVDISRRGQAGMERRVEYRHLRNPRAQDRFGGFNDVELDRIVGRSEDREPVNSLLHFRCDPGAFTE